MKNKKPTAQYGKLRKIDRFFHLDFCLNNTLSWAGNLLCSTDPGPGDGRPKTAPPATHLLPDYFLIKTFNCYHNSL